MPYDKKSFTAGIAVGRQLKGWATGGNGGQPIPPADLVPVEWVRTYGAGLDTGLSGADKNLVVEIKYLPDATGLAENSIFGAAWDYSGFFLMCYGSYYRWHTRGTARNSVIASTVTPAIIICDYFGYSVNGVYYETGSGTRANYDYPIILLNRPPDAGGSHPTSNNGVSHGRFYYCKIWREGILVRHYLPYAVKIGATDFGVIYEAISGEISLGAYYSGSGLPGFEAGPELLPEG